MVFFLPTLKKSGHLDPIQMTVAIVGSRKLVSQDDYALQGWELFAPHLTIYGFDADPDTCDEMNADIQARQVNWTEKHFPLVLWNSVGEATLYVTKSSGSSSLYAPNESYLERFGGYLELHQLVCTCDVETTTLDTFCQSEGINEIDFIHVDVQGADLQVLEGASGILKRSVLAVATEVEFNPIYVNQPLFSDVDRYLRKQEFTLLDLVISSGRGRRKKSPVISESHPGTLMWGDAFYFKDLIREGFNTPLKSPDKILKLACIADLLNFTDYALELLEYLTFNYGNDSRYNFANDIIVALTQLPEGVKQELNSEPVFTDLIAKLRDYLTDCNL